jgi:hypothetical protein
MIFLEHAPAGAQDRRQLGSASNQLQESSAV